jgi:DNA uptake protein ComE-like DNA-binding protein
MQRLMLLPILMLVIAAAAMALHAESPPPESSPEPGNPLGDIAAIDIIYAPDGSGGPLPKVYRFTADNGDTAMLLDMEQAVVVRRVELADLRAGVEQLRLQLADVRAQLETALASPEPMAPSPPAPAIDLNTADANALVALPHVGPVTAGRIIALRAIKGGTFRSPFELTAIPGLTDARIRAWIDAGLLTPLQE